MSYTHVFFEAKHCNFLLWQKEHKIQYFQMSTSPFIQIYLIVMPMRIFFFFKVSTWLIQDTTCLNQWWLSYEEAYRGVFKGLSSTEILLPLSLRKDGKWKIYHNDHCQEEPKWFDLCIIGNMTWTHFVFSSQMWTTHTNLKLGSKYKNFGNF